DVCSADLRLEEPTAGSISMQGKEMTTLSNKELRVARQDIGMIFQHFNLLWSRTTAENIAFPLEVDKMPKNERKKRVQELIDLVRSEERRVGKECRCRRWREG